MNWDLTSYFSGFDSADVAQFKASLESEIAGLQSRCAQITPIGADTAGSWEEIFLEVEVLWQRMSHLGSYLGCLTAADSANEAYKAAEAAFATVSAEAETLEVDLKRGLREASDADFSAFAQRPALAECGHYLSRLREEAQRTMSPEEERLAAALGVDGINAWGRLYSTLSGKLEFDMVYPDGRREKLPMSQRRSLMANPDRAVRRAAFEGGNAAWAQVEDVAAAAINAIAGTRLTLNERRGVDHFLDVALFQASTTRRSLDAMFEAIFDSLELPRRILRLKAQAMKTTGVSWYDLEAPLPGLGDNEEVIDWPRAKETVQTAFSRSYPRLGSFVQSVCDRNWIDWEPRANKRPGAFCTGSLLTRESRIFMTYNGTMGDVRTLAHEAGHAFHSYILKDMRAYGHFYPMTLAESASTFGEMILTEGILADSAVGAADKLSALDSATAQAAVFLMDIPMRYEFEKAFHEERSDGEVEVSRLMELMTQTQRRIFGDVLDEGGEDPYFWASKLHFYITGVTFYNFPYTFGFLLSRGLFAEFKERGSGFLPHYEEFLRLSGSATSEQLARRILGCDLESPEFWKSAIETLRQPVERLETLLLHRLEPDGVGGDEVEG